jgi:hypothetical protein
LGFGLVRFWAFKNAIKMFLQEVPMLKVKNFPQKNRPEPGCQFFLGSPLFYRVFGVFSAMGVQKHHKNVLQKNRVEKFLQKNRQKNPKPIFSRLFLIPRQCEPPAGRGGDFWASGGTSDQRYGN